jgi:hypothetical protein
MRSQDFNPIISWFKNWNFKIKLLARTSVACAIGPIWIGYPIQLNYKKNHEGTGKELAVRKVGFLIFQKNK